MRIRAELKLLARVLALLMTLLLSEAIDAAPNEQYRGFVREMLKVTQSGRLTSYAAVLADHPDIVKELCGSGWRESLREIVVSSGMSPNEDKVLILEEKLSDIFRKDDRLKRELLYAMKQKTRSERLAWLGRFPNEFYKEIYSRVTAEVKGAKISEMRSVHALLAGEGSLDRSGMPEVLSRFYDEVILPHLDQLPLKAKLSIAIEQLELVPPVSRETTVAVVLRNSDVATQKFFQLFLEMADSDDLRQIVRIVQSGLKPFDATGQQTVEIIERAYGKKLSQLFLEFEKAPFASATVGQVHRARLMNGKKVVVKLANPGIALSANEALDDMSKLAKTPAMRQIIEDIRDVLSGEFDLRGEGASNIRGQRTYENPTNGLKVARVDDTLKPHREVLVVEEAAGEPLSRIFSLERKSLSDVLERRAKLADLLNTWFEAAIFKDGFFHGDLHGYNIFFDAGDAPTRKSTLTVIDFGNTSIMSATDRDLFVKSFGGIFARSPDKMVSALRDHLPVTGEQEALLRAHLDKLFSSNASRSEIMVSFLSKAKERGIPISKDMLNFARAKMFLEMHISKLNRLAVALDPLGKTAAIDVESIYFDAVRRNLSVVDTMKIGFGAVQTKTRSPRCRSLFRFLSDDLSQAGERRR